MREARAAMRLTVGLLAPALLALTPTLAEEAWMGEVDLRAALGGKHIAGHYRTGRAFTEAYNADGSLSYNDDDRHSDGHWSVLNGTFCTIYSDDPSGGCFRVKRHGDNCFEFYFVARTEEGTAKPDAPSWTARGWVESTKDTCADGSNV
jgi:hypothetical protein